MELKQEKIEGGKSGEQRCLGGGLPYGMVILSTTTYTAINIIILYKE